MSQTIAVSFSQNQVRWKSVLSLAALNAAVVISWIAYHNYQPKLLEKFSFTDLSGFLVIAQAIILCCIPPVAGWVSDRLAQAKGGQFAVFTVGISVTAMTFMAVAFTISGVSFDFLKPALPVMIVIWLVSMNIFNSPANSMLELFAPSQHLPSAMAVITLITELLYALEPVVVYIVDFVGATFTFILGGTLLVTTAYFFRKNTDELVVVSKTTAQTKKEHEQNIPLVIGYALLFGLANAVLLNIFPEILADRLTFLQSETLEGKHYVSILLAISALAALPISKYVEQIGLTKSLNMSFAGLLLSGLSVFGLGGNLAGIFAIIYALAFSMLSVTALPFAIGRLNPRNLTFGIGIFYGCFELADGLMNIFGN